MALSLEASMNDPHITDPFNVQILNARKAARDRITGPRVGDWIRKPDGSESRITSIWDLDDGDYYQDGGESPDGSYYLTKDGHESYSGSLNPGYRCQLEPTDEHRESPVWFFDRDLWGANRDIITMVPERVWLRK